MAQLRVNDVEASLVSNAPWIDPLIGGGEIANWNWLVPARNTIEYTFFIAADAAAVLGITNGPTAAFTQGQRAAAREILAYVSSVTGLNFVETNSSEADLYFGAIDIPDFAVAGAAVWTFGYESSGNLVTSSTLNQYVFLDNREFARTNTTLVAGNEGYEVLLHEIGHTLGLKHPFESSPTLSPELENTSHTIMSYSEVGGPYATFRELDLAALAYLYGFDGVNGTWGVGGDGYYYQGTSADDSFMSRNGMFAWSGLAGHDTLSFATPLQLSSFTLGPQNAWMLVSQTGSVNYVGADIETLVFPDNAISYSELLRGFEVSAQTRFGTPDADTLRGSAGNDVLFGRTSDDILNGEGGLDSAVYQGPRGAYAISQTGTPGARRADVVDSAANRDGHDTLTGIERLKFTDLSIALDLDGAAGMTAKLLGALFGPQLVPDRLAVGIGLQLFDAGLSYAEVASRAAADPFFTQLAGSASNTAFVNHVYRNVTGSLPSQSELELYMNLLESGVHTRGSLGVLAAETPLNQEHINLVGLQQVGLEYV
jgi:hypothetical protein